MLLTRKTNIRRLFSLGIVAFTVYVLSTFDQVDRNRRIALQASTEDEKAKVR